MDQLIAGESGTKIRAVLIQEDGSWSAQCLEYDIACQAKSVPELCHELQRMIVGYHVVAMELGQETFQGIDPAPQKFWDLFEQAEMNLVPRNQSPFELSAPALRVTPDLRIAESALALA